MKYVSIIRMKEFPVSVLTKEVGSPEVIEHRIMHKLETHYIVCVGTTQLFSDERAEFLQNLIASSYLAKWPEFVCVSISESYPTNVGGVEFVSLKGEYLVEYEELPIEDTHA